MSIRLEKSRIPPHLLKYFETDLCSSCYVCHTLLFLRELRRVLRKDGVVFLNLGDSYAGSGKGQNADGSPGKAGKLQRANRGTQVGGIPVSRFDKWNSDTPGSIQVSHDTPKANYKGMKPKDLCLIPFRIAIAAQEDGWWVRSVIIWSKPNPMPESVTDRPTESHEYILMLTKSARYYWDADAVRERYSDVTLNDPRVGRDISRGGIKAYAEEGVQNPSDVRARIFNNLGTGRNIRTVWEFPTQPYPEAHFAVFPEKLPELCIKAATPEVGCCSKCGAPWERVVRNTNVIEPALKGVIRLDNKPYAVVNRAGVVAYRELPEIADIKEYLNQWRKKAGMTIEQVETLLNSQAPHHWFNGESYPTVEGWVSIKELLGFDGKYDEPMMKEYYKPAEKLSTVNQLVGWQPTCKCNADKVSSLCLDPFCGAGTTLWVAKKLNRRAVGYEISEEYCQLALERNRQQVLV